MTKLKRFDKKKQYKYTLRDIYMLYAAEQRAAGRTPLSWWEYQVSMEDYFLEQWKLLIRVGYVFVMMYQLGRKLVCKREGGSGFKLRWYKSRLDRGAFKNKPIYRFKACKGDEEHGRVGIRAWAERASSDSKIHDFDCVTEK